MYVGKYDREREREREREGDEKDEFARKYVIRVNYVNFFFRCV